MRVGFLVHRDGQDYGPFTPEQLQEGLAAGNLLHTDFCRREDQTEWSTAALCAMPVPAPEPEPSGAATLYRCSRDPDWPFFRMALGAQ